MEERSRFTKKYRDHVDSFVERGGELSINEETDVCTFYVGSSYKGDNIQYLGEDFVIIGRAKDTVSIPLNRFVIKADII